VLWDPFQMGLFFGLFNGDDPDYLLG